MIKLLPYCIKLCQLTILALITCETLAAQQVQKINEKNELIFIWGGDINRKFVGYVADLTGKENPRICYLPTASADNEENIKYWNNICKALNIEPHIMKIWVSSSEKNQSFEDILLSSDAIVVGGGNTLNMIGIWKAQGVDTVLKKALKRGIILAGGSAGSICWFKNGISDSRPVNLSVVNGLGFLDYSNCPHYSEIMRADLYHKMVKDKKMQAGYATDELAGLLFKNGKAVDFVSQNEINNSYFVCREKGEVKSIKIESKFLLNKNAIPEGSYILVSVNKKLGKLTDVSDRSTPLNAYFSEIKATQLDKVGLSEKGRIRVLNISVDKIFIYKNKLAGVVNDTYLDSFGYGLWYFYNNNGTWVSMGEDIGGQTAFESELTFREKAEAILKSAIEKFVK